MLIIKFDGVGVPRLQCEDEDAHATIDIGRITKLELCTSGTAFGGLIINRVHIVPWAGGEAHLTRNEKRYVVLEGEKG